jgi:hypothetical protein
MGTISFLVPENLTAADAAELAHACIVGGPDNMPWPSDVRIVNSHLTVRRAVEESGYLSAPLQVDTLGRLMVCSSTLMERPEPYELLVELARGKTNQLRSQYHDWCMGGLQSSPALDQALRQASQAFGEAVLGETPAQRQARAGQALALACQAAEKIVGAYVEQVFAIRHQRQRRLDSQLGCRLDIHDREEDIHAVLGRVGNSVTIDFSWRDIEPSEGRPQWDRYDALVRQAKDAGFQLRGGPLVDFSGGALPDWLSLYENDLQKVYALASRHVDMVLGRFGTLVHHWELSHGANRPVALRLGEEDLFWLTVRLIETARAVDPELEFSVGLIQPWGEYMAHQESASSPVDFADKLMRTGLNIAGLGLEFVMGVSPRGSYCRDVLELSRLLDLYAQFGIPLHVELGYPSASGHDRLADPSQRIGNGNWHGTPTPQLQAEWVAAFAALALSKPAVRSLQWTHLSDATPHVFPHCGLLDALGGPKPAALQLEKLREQHLM